MAEETAFMDLSEQRQRMGKIEAFLTNQLQPDLQHVLSKRDKIYEEIAEYAKLRNQIELIQQQKLTELSTMVDIGCNFYMQAQVPSTECIYVDIGLGFHAPLTLPQALEYIDKRETLLSRKAESLTQKASEIKAQIKFVLEGLRQIVELDAERGNMVQAGKYKAS